MRTVELAKIATAAEALRLRRIARRQAFRGAYLAGAAIFALAVLIVLHVLIYMTLAIWIRPVGSIATVLVIDVIIAGVLGYFALNNVPDAVEIEAKEIRVQAVAELKRSLTLMSMAAELAGTVFRSGRQVGVRRGVAGTMAKVATRLIRR